MIFLDAPTASLDATTEKALIDQLNGPCPEQDGDHNISPLICDADGRSNTRTRARTPGRGRNPPATHETRRRLCADVQNSVGMYWPAEQ